MITTYKSFSHITSYERMDEIINSSDSSYEELNEIPSRDRLTYTNGFYVNCTALFIDIRGSSQLPQSHTRPKLAKLYRVYISEMVAAMNDNLQCAEVSIVGDSVSGIFSTPYKSQIDDVFSTAAKLASLTDIINYKFSQYGIQQIRVGIGMDYGRALMIKSGYKGSGINDVVWMGDVVNQASKLCGNAGKSWNDRLMVSSNIFRNLDADNQRFFTFNYSLGCYYGNVVNLEMSNWLESEKAKNSSTKTYYNGYYR